MHSFNLIFEKWIPVTRLRTGLDHIAPFEITSQITSNPGTTNPVVAFAWPRPDFDLATHEFLIGLFAATYPADPRRQTEWVKLFNEPPDPSVLEAAFEPFVDAFTLDGDGPCFLQDFDPLNGEDLPIDSLFIDAPGANTIKLNKDLFIKRGEARVLSRAAAAMALYTLQQFAPSGGAGHRTSLRGGGPLITLALPDAGADSHPTLWQRLWLNTPSDLKPNVSDKDHAFPWLTATRTSANKEVVHFEDPKVHGLQAFFGMPRRIRLVFKENTEQLPCDLTGEIDEVVCTSFVTVPWGTNYGIWRHPATPYYTPKAKSDDPPLPIHAQGGRLGYRDWLGFVFEGEGKIPAAAISTAQKRLRDLPGAWKHSSRLLTAGYAMDNMKALAFAESEMPLHQQDLELARVLESFARLVVNATTVAASILSMALKRALFGEKADVKFDNTILDTGRERLWDMTESDFHKMLDDVIARYAEDENDAQNKLSNAWKFSLESVAFHIFDDTVPIESFDTLEPKDLVEARKQLVFAFKGYGKLGAEFFKVLTLEPPEQKKKPVAA